MESPPSELEGVAELFGRWRTATSAAERFQVVTDVARTLQALPDRDTRALAQGLIEHGAPGAAERIARTGVSVPAEQLTDAAQSLLALDSEEADRLEAELRDPDQRRRLLAETEDALPPARELDALPPPEPGDRPIDPGGPEDAVSDPSDEGSARTVDDGNALLDEVSGTGVPADVVDGPAPRAEPVPVADPSISELARALQRAPNGRIRLQHLDGFERRVDGGQLLHVLRSTPDGWQRRTVLRRLLAEGRVEEVGDAGAIVGAFGRSSDRFAAAALLVRAGLCESAELAPRLDVRDADRLRRRDLVER